MGAFSGESHFRTREAATAPKQSAPASAPAAANPPPASTNPPPAQSQATPTQQGPPGYLNSTSATVDPSASDPSRGFDLGPLHFGFTNRGTPGVSWQGGGWVPSSQTVHDVQDRFTNNVLKNAADPITSAVGGGDLVTLRAQREKMNQQMSPAEKGIADIGSQFTPPDMLLNRFGGPILQGGVDRGLSSYNQGNDWSTIGADTRTGLETGVAAKILSGVNSSAIAPVVRYGIEKAPAAIGFKLGDIGGGWAADKFSENFVKPFAEKAGNAINSIPDPPPWLKQAIQQVIIGGQPAASQTDAGQNVGGLVSNPNWNDAKTALQNLRGMLPY